MLYYYIVYINEHACRKSSLRSGRATALWNLLRTPPGFDSLGATDEFMGHEHAYLEHNCTTYICSFRCDVMTICKSKR